MLTLEEDGVEQKADAPIFVGFGLSISVLKNHVDRRRLCLDTWPNSLLNRSSLAWLNIALAFILSLRADFVEVP